MSTKVILVIDESHVLHSENNRPFETRISREKCEQFASQPFNYIDFETDSISVAYFCHCQDVVGSLVNSRPADHLANFLERR